MSFTDREDETDIAFRRGFRYGIGFGVGIMLVVIGLAGALK